MSNQQLSAQRARELLEYNPETGVLPWKEKRWSKEAGSVAGCLESIGYIRLGIDGKRYWAHRVIWLMVTGSWPCGVIDHRNSERADNSWANLRDVSRAVNSQNMRRPHRDSKVGLLGVSPSGDRFVASVSGKRVGIFDVPRVAHQAYISAKRRLHQGCTI